MKQIIEDAVLKSIRNAKEYTVTFIGNGGTPKYVNKKVNSV